MEIKFQKNLSISNLCLFKEVQFYSWSHFCNSNEFVHTPRLSEITILKYKMIKRDMKWALKQKAQMIEPLSENENYNYLSFIE